jgi:hypothetical protein
MVIPNKFLAIIIVLTLILSFVVWLVIAGLSLFSGDLATMAVAIIPGALIFGFWGLVIKRLYDCPTPSL